MLLGTDWQLVTDVAGQPLGPLCKGQMKKGPVRLFHKLKLQAVHLHCVMYYKSEGLLIAILDKNEYIHE